MKQDPYKTNIDAHVEFMLRMTRSYETMNAEQLGLKLFEEGGEFSTAINLYQGTMPHKTLNESPFHEAADVINALCGVLAKLYPNLSIEQIRKNLGDALKEKGEKYASIIGPER